MVHSKVAYKLYLFTIEKAFTSYQISTTRINKSDSSKNSDGNHPSKHSLLLFSPTYPAAFCIRKNNISKKNSDLAMRDYVVSQ